jgi:hypothetical protein
MADQTRRVLRLNRVKSDGTPASADVPLTLKDPATGDPLEGVVVYLQMLSEDERKAIVETHTRLEKDPNGGRGLFEFTDVRAANDEIYCKTITRWEGIVGADDRPLVCTDATKLVLDAAIRAQVMKKAFGAEVVEVVAESFR